MWIDLVRSCSLLLRVFFESQHVYIRACVGSSRESDASLPLLLSAHATWTQTRVAFALPPLVGSGMRPPAGTCCLVVHKDVDAERRTVYPVCV